MEKKLLFLGEPVDYWMELQRHAEDLQVTKLLAEIASLRARVSFYEARIAEMERFRAHIVGESA
jgi:hypothetical protein